MFTILQKAFDHLQVTTPENMAKYAKDLIGN